MSEKQRAPRRLKLASAALLAALSLFAAAGAVAQLPLPLGLQQIPHISLVGDQDETDVAFDAQGNFVVVWRDSIIDGSLSAVMARRFNGRTGLPLIDPVQINFVVLGDQRNPAVASSADGHFLVTWEGPDTGFPDPTTPGIFGSLRNPNGTPVTNAEEFPVNQTLAGKQRRPAVAMQPGGAFLVTWQSDQPLTLEGSSGENIFGRLYPANFPQSPPTSQFRINQLTSGDQEQPAAARFALNSGWFVAWAGPNLSPPTPIPSIYFRVLDSAGSPLGVEAPLNSSTTAVQRAHVALATNNLGDGVAVWEAPDASARGIFGRLITAGLPSGVEAQVNLQDSLDEREPSVALDDHNSYVVTWVRAGGGLAPEGTPIVIQGRKRGTGGGFGPTIFEESDFDGPDGAPPSDGEFQVNSAGDSFVEPRVATEPNGDFVVAWQGADSVLDPDGSAAFYRRFADAIFADGFETQSPARWSSHQP